VKNGQSSKPLEFWEIAKLQQLQEKTSEVQQADNP
jgi:hypothetical protein